jgi:DNA-binding NtrC family response regulator
MKNPDSDKSEPLDSGANPLNSENSGDSGDEVCRGASPDRKIVDGGIRKKLLACLIEEPGHGDDVLKALLLDRDYRFCLFSTVRELTAVDPGHEQYAEASVVLIDFSLLDAEAIKALSGWGKRHESVEIAIMTANADASHPRFAHLAELKKVPIAFVQKPVIPSHIETLLGEFAERRKTHLNNTILPDR